MEEFVKRASNLSSLVWREAEQLAAQLEGRPLFPLIGAGASFDCGVPLAPMLARQLYTGVQSGSVAMSSRPSNFAECRDDLGLMADALSTEYEPAELLKRVGLADETRWPKAANIPDHPCTYRVLARLARESFITETVTFNYDAHHENALRHEGFSLGPGQLGSKLWPSRYGVVYDKKSNAALRRRGDFVLLKVHGSAEHWREGLKRGEDGSSDVVIRWTSLLDWGERSWARDVVADRARRHVLLLVGFGAQDPVIHASLTQVMGEVTRFSVGIPRVRVVDVKPKTLSLMLLTRTGGPAPADAVLTLRVPQVDYGLGAVLLVLVVQLILQQLNSLVPAGVAIPKGRVGRLLAVAVTGPAMQRWTWALLQDRRPGSTGFGLPSGVGSRTAYIPLLGDPGLTSRAFETRTRLLGVLDRRPEVRVEEVPMHGFIESPRWGRAYMPLGINWEELQTISAVRLREIDRALGGRELSLSRLAVAVARDDVLHARSLESGLEVEVVPLSP